MNITPKTKSPFAFPWAKLLLLFSVLLSHLSFAHFGSKGPFGGTVTCAIAHDSIVYLGTETGGVYQSTNSRLIAWTPRPVGLKSGKITALAHTGKYLFAGTADDGVYIFNGFVGSDRYWIKKNNGLGNLEITEMIAIDSSTLLVGTLGGGIFKTSNYGDTWVSVGTSLQAGFTITGLVKAGNRIVYSAKEGGLYASDDKGNTWYDFSDASIRQNKSLVGLAYNATTDELMAIDFVTVFKLGNASSTATPVYTVSLALSGAPNVPVLHSIAGDSGNWYLTTQAGIKTTTVGMDNWTDISGNLPIASLKVAIPFRNNLVVGTKEYGVYKSISPYANWTPFTTNFNNLKTYSIATSGPFLIAASTEKGVFVSTDLAASYRLSNKGLEDSLNVSDLAFAGTQLWAGTFSKGIFVSTDTGKTWTASNTGLNILGIRKLYAISSRLYVLAGDKVYTKEVSDATWTLFQDGLPTSLEPTSMAFGGNSIFLSSNGAGVFRRTLTTEWQEFDTGLPNQGVSCLTVLGTKVFAGTYTSGVYVSDINAANWESTAPLTIPHATTIGLTSTHIQALASDKGYVFASYKGGLVATSDNGATWIEGGNQFNLPSYTNVNKIALTDNVSATARGRVFVTTENNSLYSNALSEIPAVTVGLLDEYFAAKQSLKVIPNPNKGHFKIEALSSVSEVSIYDASGRMVQTLSGTATLFSLDLKEGIYLIKAKTEKGTATQKFVVE